ncbi:Fucose permease [Streptoalloteichus tenebrarius]|uniref:Fucose permease n=1 Tax=Streptoalloteichus tenebrarius (strain ATCC 17920 / DSM 40477 / JCM 4838 / CBS 697.72 / NBRC 16177 / NCIMB 11028 / NRRL B-12390 / A12253. 1 / ISP 5477) TaxID=1933 RepID=A0ABT1HPZ1_STRSD|nr:MFS transporter [Streptoalloteichus tenebrarius]MCP2257589.1 Fucose permease [Streptoalloteichus tenebrarius]BFE98545.1 MFS transporter [Streptoalloteichus tenebrarius]
MSENPGGAPAVTAPSGPPRAARWATGFVFVLHSAVFASWTPHVPEVKDQLGLHEGTLGATLLGAPLGSVLAMLVTSPALARWGSRRVTAVALLGYALAAPLLGLAGSAVALFAALTVWGAFQGALDVAMNAQAVAVERAYDRPLMSSFHAYWSLGSVAGIGLGMGGLALGVGLAVQLAAIGVVAVVATPLLVRPMRADRVDPDGPDGPDGADSDGQHRFVVPWRHRGLLPLAGIVFAALLCEGAAGDWTAVYLRDSLGAPGAVAGVGYGAFACAMFVGRLMGDRWVSRYGRVRVVTLLSATAAVATAVTLLVGHPLVALAGFAALGLGLSCLVPVVFSAAGSLPGSHPGQSLAAVASAGWIGFLLGPPAIGGLAHLTSLPLALAVLPLLATAMAVGARTLGPRS